ncbi:MAG: MlaE family lipid ABC transporter permease subunit [Yoonia sp.]|uniref:ABC transporter permease n=1 Tax=Yoonia sp. TaxID=2212373 RepID=UPI00273DA0C2|nr:MlaE family lipid ABC transporter permease subunit [Yoonia sp.]MDP5085588.1 MlaE family lipid ABC transporter permease subunit [Yoonia sp.]
MHGSASSAPAAFIVSGSRLEVTGDLHIDALQRLDLGELWRMAEQALVIDIKGLTRIDTAGAWVLVDLQRRASLNGHELTIEGAGDAQAQLIDVVRQNMPPQDTKVPQAKTLPDRLAAFGELVVTSLGKAVDLIAFLGQVVATIATIIRHPSRLRLTSLVHHCQQVGFDAVPIVALMAFLIGVVLAFQGAAQLRQFGAEVFVVDLIAISVLRELGILLTAIIVAGRSGSAFTAAIGTMKMREEIDAMRTIGLDPVTILVVPRVLALIIMLPALGFIADISGLVGGAVMSWIELGVSPAVFQSRLVSNTDVWHFSVGMIKAPFFALIIGIVGCYEGMMVGGDAESLGRRTSISVVLSIFLVIVMDAMFSIFFAVVGV